MTATATVQAKIDPVLKSRAEKSKKNVLNDELARSLDEAREDIENDRDIFRFNSNEDVFNYLDGLKK
ncbi:MAG: hypothetical protein LBQ76_05990 [Candidatus Fibromonas sp.]|jgi:antitoxin component of RelBE/YafQ-DinJ toxin-antitoxin module|nr:hypothetical protein [Candidatus Fibromonas sp.]